MKKTFKEIGGTSFYDTVIESTVNELKHILGEPEYDGNDGEDKVNFEWEMETDNGDVFTVYDWKEYRSLSGNEVVEWHIGGFNKDVTEQAKREIENVRISW
jgi:hypothetical protein